ncbi:hypothetical protein K438DRAFT_1837071 [Mycena galopus ATCC 62051]|nr:hypothetical protein K438DRAFT_1837071 [Mycena galopus ATCC 62051]
MAGASASFGGGICLEAPSAVAPGGICPPAPCLSSRNAAAGGVCRASGVAGRVPCCVPGPSVL